MLHDLRHAVRQLLKSPGFTAIAVVSIAFGTGANVAIFSAVDALLLRPLPVSRPSEILTIGAKVKRGVATLNVASYPDYADIRDRSTSFDGILAYTSRSTGFRAGPASPTRVRFATLVSGNFFRVLGLAPMLGRDFRPEEDRVAGRDAVVILSYGLWQSEFGGDPSALGRTVRVGGVELTVVGVLAEGFNGIEARDVLDAAYVPLAMWPRLANTAGVDPLRDRGFRALTLKGRLKPGATIATARAELAAIGRDLERAHPDTNKEHALTAQTELQVKFERNPLDSGLLVILTILSLAVLCVACANVAGLLASRAPVRAREIALRLAIGAGRVRLIRQLMLESLSIALAGAAGGLAVGYAGIILLRQIQFPTEVIAVPVMQMNERALALSLLLALGSTLLFGVGPAIYTTRVDLASALKATDSTANRRDRLTGRNVLVAVQMTLSLVLVTITMFAVQVFRRELADGPGFRTSQLAKATIDVGQARYADDQAVHVFERALDNARALPGVTSAAVTSAMPLFSFEVTPIVPEGYILAEGQTGIQACSNSVDESYFDTMQIAILAGRAFRASDDASAPRVAIVNDTLARHYWPDHDAVGKRFRLGDGRGPWIEIVGVAKTTQYWYPGEIPQDAVYLPFRQRPRGNMVLLAATAGESASLLAPLREMMFRFDAAIPTYDVQTIELFYRARATTLATVMTRLIGGMGLMGMILTMVGLYGLVSFAVNRRRREIGIRVAVGAGRGRVVGMILRQGLVPAGVGLVLGIGLSVAATRVIPMLAPFRYRYEPRWFFIVVPILFSVALLASFVPARRAARVDPTVALRCE